MILGAVGSNYDNMKSLDTKDLIGLVITGFFYFLAQITRNRALYLEKPFFVGVGGYLQMIINYFMDLFIFGIELSGYAILGCVVVVTSIILMIYYDQRKTIAKN